MVQVSTRQQAASQVKLGGGNLSTFPRIAQEVPLAELSIGEELRRTMNDSNFSPYRVAVALKRAIDEGWTFKQIKEAGVDYNKAQIRNSSGLCQCQ